MDDEQKLAEVFRALGARKPSEWAHSQVQEGLPQLARFLFLRQAWRLIVGRDDTAWIRSQLETPTEAPGGVIAQALRRVLACGVSEGDLTAIVRVMQWRLLSGLCYLLDDPGDLEQPVRDIGWRLFQVNDQDEPVALMAGLHESVLDTEPSGREMIA